MWANKLFIWSQLKKKNRLYKKNVLTISTLMLNILTGRTV